VSQLITSDAEWMLLTMTLPHKFTFTFSATCTEERISSGEAKGPLPHFWESFTETFWCLAPSSFKYFKIFLGLFFVCLFVFKISVPTKITDECFKKIFILVVTSEKCLKLLSSQQGLYIRNMFDPLVLYYVVVMSRKHAHLDNCMNKQRFRDVKWFRNVWNVKNKANQLTVCFPQENNQQSRPQYKCFVMHVAIYAS